MQALSCGAKLTAPLCPWVWLFYLWVWLFDAVATQLDPGFGHQSGPAEPRC
jgi:hypothetical protein